MLGEAVAPGDLSESRSRPRIAWSAWHTWLAAIVAAGLAVRLGYLVGWNGSERQTGDAVYYHVGANLLADGYGFIHPVAAAFQFREIPGADHPPAFIVYLAVGSLVGLRSFFEHQVLSCVLGAATVGVVGLTGRRIGGPRSGLAAAALAAIFPMMWMPDAWVLSETMAMFAVALVILAAYRCWEDPRRATAAWLGAALGLAALSRPELVLLGPLIAVRRPTATRRSTRPRATHRRRFPLRLAERARPTRGAEPARPGARRCPRRGGGIREVRRTRGRGVSRRAGCRRACVPCAPRT